MSNFEKFTQKKYKSATKPLATITKDKSINLNYASMKNIVQDNKYAVLYFDKENSMIGIRFSNKNTPEAYTIRKYRDNHLGIISIVAFLRYYVIEHKKTLVYNLYWNDQDKMAIIDLKEHFEDIPESGGDDEVPF